MNRTKTLGWLVMAAALLFAGCSSENDLAEEPKTIEPQPTTIRVTVGAGISDGATRSTVDYSGGTRTLQFTSGDRLYVWGHYGDEESEPSGMTYYPYIVAGYLALDTESFDDSDPTNATFTGELTVYSWVNEEGSGEGADYIPEIYGYYDPVSSSGIFSTADPLGECNDVTGTLIHEDAVKDVDYVIYEGDRMVYYMPDCAATVEALMTTGLVVSGSYNAGTRSFALTKDTDQPIVNCTIAGLEAGVSYKVDYIYGTTAAMSDHTKTLFSSLTATAGTLSFAFIAETGDNFHGIRLTNTADAGDTYTVSIGQKALQSKVYNLSRRFVDLSSVTTTDGNGKLYFAAQNGDVLTGNFSGEAYLTIADGATVTLSDVNFTAPFKCDHAAIHCLGSANIIVSGSDYNDVNAGDGSDYPAVYVPSGKTLTISGTGELRASTQDSNGAAYIGGGNGIDCGNIVIAGGTVIATGGSGAAGIGSGQNGICGDITITGGNVMAMGGDSGAGIGSGVSGSCGDISITAGTVEATGCESAAGIGSGNNGLCGDITIGSGITRVDVKKGYISEYIIGGYKHGMVKIDGKEMSSDQLRHGLYSYPSEVEHIFPNLSSNCDGSTWTLYKE